MSVSVLLAGYELYPKYIDEIINVFEQRTFKKDKLYVNEYTIKVKNFDNFFSIDNLKSPFVNGDWLFQPFVIIVDGEELWNGIVTDIQPDSATGLAYIVSKNSLAKYFSRKIAYESSDWETGAEAFKNICDSIGFTSYNLKAVQDSINRLVLNSCKMKCRFDYDQGLKFQQVIEKISEYSAADCFINKDEIYFKVHTPYTGGAIGEISELDLIALPRPKHLVDDMINQYRIGYEGDNEIPATDSDVSGIGIYSRNKFGIFDLPEMDGSKGQIVIKDLTSAKFIGETYIKRTHKNLLSEDVMPLREMTTQLKYGFKWIVDINTFYKQTLVDQGWNQKIFEITETNTNKNNNTVKITSLEVDTTEVD